MLLPLLAATSLLPLSVLAHSHYSNAPHSHANSRKTLSFGPAHPHAKFHTHHHHTPSSSHAKRQSVVVKDGLEVAKEWLRNELPKGTQWFVRDDSYTDKNTRITHVYARQLVNGIEVVDGDINLNIDANGNVISSGSSFYAGAIPSLNTDDAPSPSSPHCATLHETLTTASKEFRSLLSSLSFQEASEHLIQYGHDQVTFGGSSNDDEDVSTKKPVVDHDALARISQTVKELHRTAQAMCPLSTLAKSALTQTIHSLSTPHAAPALLAFIALVTPDTSLASRLHDAPQEFLSLISSEFEHSLLPGGTEKRVEVLTGVPEAISPVKATVGWIQDAEEGLKMVWRFEVEMKDNWYEGTVDVKTGQVVGAVDWARDAPSPKPGKKPSAPSVETYNVWPFGVNDPVSGKRSVLTAPFDEIASPYGWHSYPGLPEPFTSATPGVTAKGGWVNTTTTIGNNVFAQENWEGQSNYVLNGRPLANSSLLFDFEYGEEEGLRPKEYVDLAVTELFYTCNMFHDLTYRLGFDELAGNFQQSNYGRGGKGDDAVIANAQDGSGTNNANFATPPDGQHGKMRMYVWDTATPYRDGDLEAGIVIHEFAHGLSTRLTGGPANSGCLGWGEAGGMGEGWGDFLATQIRKPSAKYSDYPMGAWAANREGGIRNYPYSVNETINPSTYKTLDKSGYFGVHAIGEVWAEFLFVMTEALIAKHGFSTTLFPPTNTSVANEYYTSVAEFNVAGELLKPLIPKHGNTLAVQLVINGLKLQPCRPSFFDARDAIVQADKILTGGENACEIWTAFTERGLGPEAALRGATPWGGGIRVEDYELPKGVCKKTKKVVQ